MGADLRFSPLLRHFSMISEDHTETLYEAVQTYGVRPQELIAVEEMAELIKEIMKCHRHQIEPTEAMLEEFVDVCICMAQIEFILKCHIDGAPEQMLSIWKHKMDILKSKIECRGD